MEEETARNAIAAAGTQSTADKLAAVLREAGFAAKVYGLVKLEARAGWDAGVSLDAFDWLVFSSPAAVHFTLDQLGASFDGRVACLGEGTAEAARDRGLEVALLPEEATRDGLLESFRRRGESAGRAFVPMGSAAPEVLPDGLRDLGLEVTAPVVYDNLPEEPAMRAFARDADAGVLAAAAFTSASAVDYGNFALGLPNLRIYCIGPGTAERARRKGLKPAGVADPPGLEGLVEAIKRGERG